MMFDHTKEVLCPVTKCQLMATSCSGYFPEQTNILIDAKIGKVTAITNFKDGYEVSFCYGCTISPVEGGKTISKTIDNLKIV